MPRSTRIITAERPRPLFSPLALLLCATVALTGCVSTKGKDPLSDLLTPDQEAVDAQAAKSSGAYDESLAASASPSPEYQTASARDGAAAAPEGAAQAAAGQQASPDGVVMAATGINANRSSIFSSAAPAVAADPVSAVPGGINAAASAPGGINARGASVFSTSGKNPLLSTSNDDKEDSAAVTAYMEEDDVPLILRGKLYSSKDLGPDPTDAATDMVTLASLPSMTRQSATGLLIQRPSVQTSCFKPKLVSMLKEAEQHFGGRIVVTSGFRDPEHNQSVGGAKHSMHLSCDAADIQMVGISKWDLARYFRGRPDIGGVGTYCSTNSIHVDIGRRRDWNWKCRADTML